MVVAVAPTSVAVAGQEARFDITVSNAGGLAASATVGVSFGGQGGVADEGSAAGDGWTCDTSRCTTSADVPPGGSLPPIHVSVPVLTDRTTSAAGSGRVLLNASVDGDDDAIAGNDQAMASIGIRAATLADAALTLRPPAIPPRRGASTEFEAVVADVGAAPIKSRVELAFDASLSGQGPGWTCPSGSGRCVTDADIAPGGMLPMLKLRSQTEVDSSQVSAAISARIETADDPVSENNEGSAQTPLVPLTGPDLTLTMRPGAPVRQGSTATGLVTVTNMGNVPSSGTIEISYEPEEGSASGAGWTCPAGSGHCVTSATNAPGASLPALEVRAPTDPSASRASLSASVSGGGDGLTFDNTASVIVPLTRSGDAVDVVATGTPHYDPATRALTWTVAVNNAGATVDGAETEVSLDPVSAAAVFGGFRSLDFTVSGAGWTCANGRCVHPGPIAAGGTLPDLVLAATLPADMGSSLVSFSSSVRSAADEDSANDFINASMGAGGIGPDLGVRVSADGSVKVGDSASASIEVVNTGNETVSGQVRVRVGSSLAVAASGSGWQCGDDLVCTHPGPVPVGGALPALQLLSPTTPRDVGQQSVFASVDNDSDQVPNDDQGRSSYGVGGVVDDVLPVLEVAGPWAVGEVGRASIAVANAAPTPRTFPVTVQLNAPEDAVPRGDGWICTTSLVCTYSDPIAAGASSLPLELLSPLSFSQPVTSAGISASLVSAADEYPFNDTLSATVAVATRTQAAPLQAEFSRDGTGDLNPGQPEHVVLSVRNAAPADDPGPFSVRVTPSQGITVESISGTGWTCDATLLCRRSLSTLSGEATPLELTVRASSSASDAESLLASVRHASAPPVPALLPLPLAAVSGIDLLQEVEAVDATPAGAPAEFRVRVRNGGEVAARERVQVGFSLGGRANGAPVGAGAGWTCPAGESRCVTDADVPPGGALPDLAVLVPASDGAPGGSVTLRSDLEGVADDAYHSNDAGQARSPVVARAGVDLVPSVAIAPDLAAGKPATSTLNVHNVGSAAASGQVMLRYSVSGSVAGEPQASGPGWLCAESRCLHAGPLPSGGSLPPLTLTNETLRNRSSSSSYGNLTVSAAVADAEDAVDTNDSTSVRAPLFAYADVDLTYSLRPESSPLPLGLPPRYLGTVANVGTEPATEPTEVETPPGWSASGAGWVCPDESQRCITGADLAPGEELPEILLSDPSESEHPGRRSAFGAVRSPQDGEPSNDDTTVSAPVSAPSGPDLVAVMTPHAPSSSSDSALFDAVVRNAGGTATTGITTVTLRPDTATASGSGWSCAGTTCTTSAVAAANGSLPPLTVSRPTSSEDTSADAGITVSATADSSPANDDAGAGMGLVGPGAGPDLRLQGTLVAPARPGGNASWSLVAVNGGTAATPGEISVSVSSPFLSAGSSRWFGASASGAGWSCDESLTCTHAALATGATSAPLLVKYSVPGTDALGVVSLSAFVSVEEGETTGGNNSLSLSYGVGGVLRNLVASVSSPSGVTVDGELEQLATVRNLGSQAIAGPVELGIDLPSPDAVLAGGAGWNCDTATHCSHPGPLAPGAALPDVSIDTPAPPSDGARTFNTTVETGADDDEITADNTVSTSVGRGIAAVDLAAEITGGAPVHQGETAGFEVTVRNGGSRVSDGNWTLDISAPAGSTAQGSGWICTSGLSCAGVAVAPHGVLPPLHVSVPASAQDGLEPLGVAASIEQSDDQYTSNDFTSASVGVGGPRVDVTALVRPLGRWRAGSPATFRAEVANHGSSPATGEVNVALESPYPGAEATGADWVCTSNLHCVHDGPIEAGGGLPPLNVSVPVPGSAEPSNLLAGVSVDVDADQVTSNDRADLVTGVERQLEVRRAALFDAEAQRSRLPLGGSTPIQVRLAAGVDPQQATLAAFLPDGLNLDPAGTGAGLTDPALTPVAGGTRVVWDVVPGQPDSARTFTVTAARTAPTGPTGIQLELASELTAAAETDDAPLQIVRPALGEVTPAVVSASADQTLSVAGTDFDPSYRLAIRQGATTIPGGQTTTSAFAMTAVFDLNTLEPGDATVVVEAADGNELATESVTVAEPEYRDPQIAVTVASRVRINTEAFAFVSVHNPSNVDIRMVPLVVTTPPGVELHPDGSGGREMLQVALDKFAGGETPAQFRITEADRDDLVAHLADVPPVRTDPQSGGLQTIVVMPRIPAGGTARLRIGVLPRVLVTAPILATIPIERALFAQTGYVTDPVRRILDMAPGAPSSAVLGRQRAARSTDLDSAMDAIDCSGIYAEVEMCPTMRLYTTGIDETRRTSQAHACTSYTSVTFGTVGADCQVDPTGPVVGAAKKKFPLLSWLDNILGAFDLYGDLSDAADNIESAGAPMQFGVQSVDPNEKLGPVGYGADRWISGEDPLTYTIQFENAPSATAAAQQVRLTDVLPTGLDPSTVQVVGAEVGGTPIPMATANTAATRSATGSALLDPASGRDVLLDVDVDVASGELLATFRGSPHLDDPLTPTAFGDFLPPDDDDRRGEGSITFTAQADPGLPTGASVSNVATIVFDPHADGPSIETPAADNRIDRTAPTVNPPEGSVHVGEALAFGADDEGSGVAEITVAPIREGAVQAPIVLAPGVRQFNAPDIPGTYQFDVRVSDGIGRVAEKRSEPIVITPAPVNPGNGPGATPSSPGAGDGGSSTPGSGGAPRIVAPAKLKRAALGKGIKIAVSGLLAHSAAIIRLKLGARTILAAIGKADGDGELRMTLKLNDKQRSAMAKASKLTIAYSLTDPAGRKWTPSKTIRIARSSTATRG